MWQTVELRELRAFLTLADELHFGRTAQRLSLTPARVSQTIRQLEARVGGKLFERTSRRVALTPAGVLLRDRIRRPYDELEAGFNETRTAATGLAGTLRVGMYTPINGGPHLAEIMRGFEQRHPGCTASVIDTGLERNPLDWLRSGDVDMLAMRLPVDAPDLAVGPVLSSEGRVVALARDHPLAGRASVGIEDLADYTVAAAAILPPETIEALTPSVTPSGRPITRATVRTFAEGVVRIARGELVHMTVRSFADYYRHPHVTFVPLDDTSPSRTALVHLAATRDRRIPAFTDTAAAVLAEHSS